MAPDPGPTPDRAPLAAIAWGATIVWLAIAALVYFGMSGGEAGLDPLRVMMVPVAVFGPVALVWIAALNAMRLAEIRRALAALGAEGDADLSRKLDAVLKAQGDIEARLAGFAAPEASTASLPRERAAADTRRPPEPARRARAPEDPPPAEPARHAGSPKPAESTRPPASSEPAPPETKSAVASSASEAEARPGVETATLIAALQFPADPDDQQGFRAMRRAHRDPAVKPVVSAAQDVLTLLSQDGIYMDDFATGELPPDILRRFAEGERGAGVSAAGAVRDEAAENRIAERLESDRIFRDATHHFVRMFDRLLADLAPRAPDEALADLARTRTGRAYMLIGRPLGTFG
jgi:hypothetical protein